MGLLIKNTGLWRNMKDLLGLCVGTFGDVSTDLDRLIGPWQSLGTSTCQERQVGLSQTENSGPVSLCPFGELCEGPGGVLGRPGWVSGPGH